ncbi:NAD-dependent epimerase/dehydratase family protein [Haloferax sp. MBLA0076]|uniref:NAD-dependent epimerase/dehydratase family protein n=1 Tax=Haloferax litoreum TaxID=2666140 RepID=A0A6A8GKP3_9EURY|nr:MULTISPECIES: NAD-dependent epimerase/dehydratase family protein [Haloferax]KAB1189925.1 NAD-dependent epimerase/dehydratase family protein [Haloferax sp. CBA1148]MRX23695.1 NAD-dependent epimerase/dehydratase family protein [Haloferax litoreum]
MNAPISDQTVLVTGGAGFIGSHLVDALHRTNEVRVLDDFSSGHRDNLPSDVTLIEGNILNDRAVRTATDGVDVIFHEAAVVDVGASVERPLETHDVNCTGGLTILDRARDEDARVVVASSAAVYGQPTRIPVSEDDPLRPTSPYGLQKVALDRYATMYHDLYGLETVALRYFNVYGRRGEASQYSGVIDAFVRRSLEGDPLVIFGDGTQTRDFVHVDDVVQANLLAATTDNVGTAYNIGTGDSVSIRDLASTIVELTDRPTPVQFEPARPGDIAESEADITRARRDLGFEPTVSLRNGLGRIVSERKKRPTGYE